MENNNDNSEQNKNDVFVLLVVGSRTITDYEKIKNTINFLLPKGYDKIEIVSGGAKGVDSLAEKYAKEKKINLRVFKAKWSLYGKTAGPIRNREMHEYIAQFPHRGCVIFWDGKSKGAYQSVELSKHYETPMRLIKIEEN